MEKIVDAVGIAVGLAFALIALDALTSGYGRVVFR